jgi:hypothetical protein
MLELAGATLVKADLRWTLEQLVKTRPYRG